MKKKYTVFMIIFTLITLIFLSYYTKIENTTITVYEPNSLNPIYKGNNPNYIAFTCNVDWGTELIPEMLNIFKKYNINITFFVSGRWAKNNPEMLKTIFENGHEIGNHGYKHRMHSRLNWNENYKEIYETHQIVKHIIGIDMTYFAPPAGDFNDTTLKVADKLGYKTILWSIDTIDWRKDATSQKIISRVLKKPLKGAIVLMHPKKETIKSLPVLIESIKSKGVKIGTVSNVLR